MDIFLAFVVLCLLGVLSNSNNRILEHIGWGGLFFVVGGVFLLF